MKSLYPLCRYLDENELSNIENNVFNDTTSLQVLYVHEFIRIFGASACGIIFTYLFNITIAFLDIFSATNYEELRRNGWKPWLRWKHCKWIIFSSNYLNERVYIDDYFFRKSSILVLITVTSLFILLFFPGIWITMKSESLNQDHLTSFMRWPTCKLCCIILILTKLHDYGTGQLRQSLFSVVVVIYPGT